MGVIEFKFIWGSMGSVVGEKITPLIEYATNINLYLLFECVLRWGAHARRKFELDENG